MNSVLRKLTRFSLINEKIEPALEIKIREYLAQDIKQSRLLTGQHFNSWSI